MKQYHKIQSIFKRDMENKGRIIEGSFAIPELEYLQDNLWEFTEKIDGTNIRVMWTPNDAQCVKFGGKTDNARIYVKLLDTLNEIFTAANMRQALGDESDICLYGEGYGAKIQKGGGNYISDGVDFILFDVRVGNWWLKREDVEDIADSLGVRCVPIIGYGTLNDAIEMTRKGFNSTFGDFIAEGLVLKPKVNLLTRGAGRIITKVKHKDFK